jgi:hypothetical protein
MLESHIGPRKCDTNLSTVRFPGLGPGRKGSKANIVLAGQQDQREGRGHKQHEDGDHAQRQ